MPCRVLLIDDEADACLVTSDVLEHFGYQVHTVTDPLEAIRVGCEFPFDVVLLDIRMPGVSGMDVLRRIRDRGHGAILVLTGYIDDELEAEAAQEGATEVLHKPVDPHDLLERIRALHS